MQTAFAVPHLRDTVAIPDDSARGLNTSILVDEFRCETDGRAKRIFKDDIAQGTVTEERTEVDASTNWEPVPTFGDWQSVTRSSAASDPIMPRHECPLWMLTATSLSPAASVRGAPRVRW
jgi:hypothetical protein